MIRTLIIFTLLTVASIATAQIRPYQIKGQAPFDSLWILGTDTTTGSVTQGLGKWYSASSLGAFSDTDWLTYRTNDVPDNADTMYHTGIANIGDDTTYSGALNVTGRIDVRFPNKNLSNVALGNNAISDIATGNLNIAIGGSSLAGLTSGGSNVSIGNQSGVSTTTGESNLFFGTSAGRSITTGNSNTILGNEAGFSVFLNGGSNHNVWIGRRAGYVSGTIDSTLAIDVERLGTSSLVWGDFGSNLFHITGKLKYTTEGSTATTISGRDASEYFTDVTTGWGIDLTGGALVVDSSEVATQYDLTTISGGSNDHDWYEVGGSSPPNHIDDHMYSGSGDHGIGTNTPAKPLHVVGEARITGSGGTATTITGRDADEDLTDVTTGWGIDLTGGALIVDTSEVATQYDITTVLAGGMTNWFIEASGTGGSEEVNNAETVTITGAGINTATRVAGNVTITGTEVDGSTTNEAWTIDGDAGDTEVISSQTVLYEGTGIVSTTYTSGTNTLTIDASEVDGSTSNELQSLAITGVSAPYTLDISLDANDVQFNRSGIVTLTESPANTLVIGAVEVDGSVTNEAWTADADDADTELITNQTVKMEGDTGIIVDWDGFNNKFVFDFKGDDFSTVTTLESDDYLLIHDENAAAGDVSQKILWTDLYDDLISFEEGNIFEGGGNTIDFGLGIDLSVASGEADVTLDFNEFTTDAATEGDEYVIVYDPSAGVHEKVLVTSVSGGFDGNGFFDSGNDGANIPTGMNGVLVGTWQLGDGSESDLYVDGPNDRLGMGTASPSYGVHVVNNSGMAVESETAGTGGLILKLEGKADGGSTNTQQTMLQMAFTDADYASGIEQTALEVTLDKQSDLAQWSTITMRMKENTDADVMVFEKNVDFSANTTESHIAMNGGRAYTQNYDWNAAGADLTLDRSYHIINVLAGAVGDEINLPEVASTLDNFDPTMTAAQCQVGQEYTITNFRAGTNLIIRVFAGDNINNGGTTATLVPGDSMIFKCVRFSGGVGYWYVYD